jgi:hypothetical protein
MRRLSLLSTLTLAASACTFHTHHSVHVVRTVTAHELSAAAVPLAPGETDRADRTELVTKDGQTFRIEQGRFQRTEAEIIAWSDIHGLRSFPIDDVRRVVLVDEVERRSAPESNTSASVPPVVTALLIVVGVAAVAFGGFVAAMSGM